MNRFVLFAVVIGTAFVMSDPVTEGDERAIRKHVRESDETVNKVFQGLKGKTYILFTEKKTMSNARATCQALGGDLAVLLSYKEFDAVAQNVKHAMSEDANKEGGDWIFVGAQLYGVDLKNDWFWLSGEPLPYNSGLWARYDHREPDMKSQRCTVIVNSGRKETNGPALFTHGCENQNRFLCQLL